MSAALAIAVLIIGSVGATVTVVSNDETAADQSGYTVSETQPEARHSASAD